MNERIRFVDKLSDAEEQEINDQHLDEEKRKQLVAEFESLFPLPADYPAGESVDERFVYLLFEWEGA